ncbi:hypothetical protein [Terrabacter sp. NPDC080008]|uniref:hypothetical protein n=1 Tax=Terrabacter sp. NPDC080008 TaxID=3155176 RepID=UPI00344CCA00
MSTESAQLAAAAEPTPAGAVVQWGFLTITAANLVTILLMIAVFVLAVLLPFPGSHDEDGQ